MYHSNIKAQKKILSNKSKVEELDCKVIAEIGINHRGDLLVAKELIKLAKSSGCWGVKFQFRDANTFYKRTDEISDEIVFGEIRRNHISVESLGLLGNYCRDLGIKFGVSVFRVEDLGLLGNIFNLIDFFKVPSAECLNTPLINELIVIKKLIFISLGGTDTTKAIQSLSAFKSNLIAFHCISNYPTKLGEQDLAVIETLNEAGFGGVGYSSHDTDWEVCLLALANGARWIERHITLDKTANGLDHSSSSTVEELQKLVNFCSSYSRILGKAYHSPNQGELINLQNLGTSVYAKRDLNVEETTSLADYDIKAPRVGMSVGEFRSNFEGKRLISSRKKGEVLTLRHFSNEVMNVPDKVRQFSRSVNLGLPVRLHDYLPLKKKFDLRHYEFHLSFSETLSDDLNRIIENIDSEETISVHLPDYIPGNRLLDPISRDKDTREFSRKIIQNVSSWCEKVQQKIDKKVNIVGSFSCTHNHKKEDNLDEIFDFISNSKITILPQWLPVYAWYFGGTMKLNLFNSVEDINYLQENDQKICLDFSHLVMASSYYRKDWRDWFEALRGNIEHIHISDAADDTSEGLSMGEGLIGDFSDILSIDKMKIIEPWQGHMNGGEGFLNSLLFLENQFSTVDRSHEKKN